MAGYGRRQQVGLVAGPVLFGVVRLFAPGGLTPAAAAVLASALWIATWWISEAVPIPVTSLLPIVLFPVQGVTDVAGAAGPYADPVVFLFLGGFLVALAIERWELHRRIALEVIARAGSRFHSLLAGFMLATAVLSMWISNTATAMLMLPIGMAVIAQLEAIREPGPETDVEYSAPVLDTVDVGDLPRSNAGAALILGIAYGATIGGVATLIGTPPNAILAGVLRTQLDVELGFLEWMVVGLPLAAVFLVVAWGLLLRLLPPEFSELPGATGYVARQRAALGPMGRGERRVLAVFALVAAGWVLRPFVLEPFLPGVSDTTIAVGGGILVFLVPVDLRRGEFLLDWEATTRVPWGVLLLFGGGFSLAGGVRTSGLDRWLAGLLTGLRGAETVWIVFAVAVVIIVLTEISSNSATASLFIPLMASLGLSLAVSPVVLMVTAAIAASLAFMLPVATPPNAIVFGSGYVSLPQMARVGIWLNLIAVVLVTLIAAFWVPIAWGL
jgi:sodium-dependent dicarboxylate transporter 2/3/5